MQESPETHRDESRWPLAQMLMRGTFATGTKAERRVAFRSNAVVAVVVGWTVATQLLHVSNTPVVRVITVLLAATALTYYAWEKIKYFLTLDELTRRIEMEGMAWAYVVGVLVAIWAGSIEYVVSVWWPPAANIGPWRVAFMFAMLLALVKGAYRCFATRRY